ncbi:hypothetical protein G9A89_020774 [Geosiphon pyriformis]|nr:hypothetical protein G9A89_020774 [Geosiphon pyriformis]
MSIEDMVTVRFELTPLSRPQLECGALDQLGQITLLTAAIHVNHAFSTHDHPPGLTQRQSKPSPSLIPTRRHPNLDRT